MKEIIEEYGSISVLVIFGMVIISGFYKILQMVTI